jgi:hypothetical protein
MVLAQIRPHTNQIFPCRRESEVALVERGYIFLLEAKKFS